MPYAHRVCGRYTLSVDPEDVYAEFDWLARPAPALGGPYVPPRYNIAPTQDALVVGQRAPEHPPSAALFRWGFVPHWAKDLKGPPRINARVETVQRLPMFRDAFRQRRCLVPATGWVEWPRRGAAPVHLVPSAGGLLTLAGIWTLRRGADGDALRSFTILTREARGVAAEVHARMPVVVPPAHRRVWLDPEVADPRAAILDAADPALSPVPLSKRINKVTHDDPACLEPAS